MELNLAVFNNARGVFLELVNSNKPLFRLPRLQLGVAAIARHNGVIQILNVVQQTQGLEFFHNSLTRFVAIHAAELAISFHHMGGLIENVDFLQVMSLAHSPVIRVMRRRNLNAARTKLRINMPVGENGDLTADNGQRNGLAHQLRKTFILGVHGNACIAQHGFRTRGGNNQVLHAVNRLGQRVTQIPQMACIFHVFRFVIGNGSRAVRAPVHNALALINQTLVIPVGKHLANSQNVIGIKREMLVFKVTRAAHTLNLVHDGSAIFAAPVVACLDKLLATNFQTRDTLVSKLLVNLCLRCNTSMVGTNDPTRLIAPHARTANAGILDGFIQGVTHVQNARDVRRRNNNGKRVIGVLALAFAAAKIAFFHPLIKNRSFMSCEVVIDLLCLSLFVFLIFSHFRILLLTQLIRLSIRQCPP